MTVTVALDVRCDWCGIAIASMHPGLQRVALHRLDEALAALLENAKHRGHAIGGPPGRPLHLCRACHGRGTPPVRLPPKPKRTRKPKSKPSPQVMSTGTEGWHASCPPCGWRSPKIADHATAVQALEEHDRTHDDDTGVIHKTPAVPQDTPRQGVLL